MTWGDAHPVGQIRHRQGGPPLLGEDRRDPTDPTRATRSKHRQVEEALKLEEELHGEGVEGQRIRVGQVELASESSAAGLELGGMQNAGFGHRPRQPVQRLGPELHEEASGTCHGSFPMDDTRRQDDGLPRTDPEGLSAGCNAERPVEHDGQTGSGMLVPSQRIVRRDAIALDDKTRGAPLGHTAADPTSLARANVRVEPRYRHLAFVGKIKHVQDSRSATP